MNATGDTLLECVDLTLGHGGPAVLERVNLTVRSGDRWFLLGPNGRGKSTLLQALLGALRPTAGEVRRSISLREIGFIPQRCDLNPCLSTTVREFVLLGGVGLRLSRAEREARLDKALRGVELQGLERKSYWSLSGGQRQRVLVARALMRAPRLLIADEPTNGLDPGAEDGLMDALAALHRDDGVTLVFVTHTLRLAAGHARQLALFSNRGVRCGPVAAMLRPENLADVYGAPVGAAHLGGLVAEGRQA